MDARTLTALKGSIEKWEKIVAGTGRDDGRENCPLCVEFYSLACRGCPVRDNAAEFCEDSPYQHWDEDIRDELAFTDENESGYKHNRESRAAATAELEFLKSLLPRADRR